MTMFVDPAASSAPEALLARIAELEQQLQQLHDENWMLMQLLDFMPEMVICKTPQSQVCYANSAFRRFHGFGNERAQDLKDTAFATPEESQRFREQDLQIIASGQPLQAADITRICADGAARLTQTSKMPLRDSSGQVSGIIAIIRDVTEQRRSDAVVELYTAMVQHMPLGLMVYRQDDLADPGSLRLLLSNAIAHTLIGINLDQYVGRTIREIFSMGLDPQMLAAYANVIRTGRWQYIGELNSVLENGSEVVFEIQAYPLPNQSLCVVFENITERKLAEAAQLDSFRQEQMILAQAAALEQLSTPLIPINSEVMVMPLIGSIDSRRAQQVLDTVLQGISASHAQVVILDITGVPVVDTQVANALVRTAQAVRLLGAQIILTGIRPEVAQTLVGLGSNLIDITTHSSLQSGIAHAMRGRA